LKAKPRVLTYDWTKNGGQVTCYKRQVFRQFATLLNKLKCHLCSPVQF
jgi:hypothetical protein